MGRYESLFLSKCVNFNVTVYESAKLRSNFRKRLLAVFIQVDARLYPAKSQSLLCCKYKAVFGGLPTSLR